MPKPTIADPAIERDPREGTTAAQNVIVGNDPTLTGVEAVHANLGLDHPDTARDVPVITAAAA